MTDIKTILLSVIPLFLMTGCLEGRVNTKQLCADNPELKCEKLNMNDGQCRVPRTDLIWQKMEDLKNPTPENKIQVFHFVDAYQKCLDLAAQIEPTKPGNKKEVRFNALLHTYEEQKRLLNELRKESSPEALYFLWTKGDHSAKLKFLKLEGSGKLQTAHLQYALATYYITRNKEKTLALLENALVLTQEDQLNSAIIEALASVNQALGNKQHAYIWVLVAKELELPLVSDRNLAVLYQFSEEENERFKKIASKMTDAIEDGKYRENLLPDYKTE